MENNKPYWDNAADFAAGKSDIFDQNWAFPTGEYVEQGWHRDSGLAYQRVTYQNGAVIEVSYDARDYQYKIIVPELGTHVTKFHNDYTDDDRRYRMIDLQQMTYHDDHVEQIRYIYTHDNVLSRFEIVGADGELHYLEADAYTPDRHDFSHLETISMDHDGYHGIKSTDTEDVYAVTEDMLTMRGWGYDVAVTWRYRDDVHHQITFQRDGSVTRLLHFKDTPDLDAQLSYYPANYYLSVENFIPDQFRLSLDDIQRPHALIKKFFHGDNELRYGLN